MKPPSDTFTITMIITTLVVAALLTAAFEIDRRLDFQHSGSVIQRLDRIETLLLKGNQ